MSTSTPEKKQPQPQTQPSRKGARRIEDIPKEVLKQLNQGTTSTVNLTEALAVDHAALLKTVLQQWQRTEYLDSTIAAIDLLPKQTFNTLNQTIGAELGNQALKNNDPELFNLLTTHPADTVRCWASYALMKNESLTLTQRFALLQPLAADTHFGVREVAWMAVRPYIKDALDDSIDILKDWSTHEDANIRRFASEATRPRGVWCAHIQALKDNPELGLPILNPLYQDPEKYVQDSVGNWLNDASKTQPDFVKDLFKKWQAQSDSKATAYIIKKAMRTIRKEAEKKND